MTEKYTEDKRLLGALDYIDEKYIAEVTEDYEIFDPVGKPTREMRLRIARQYIIYAACLVLLACAMPIVGHIVPQIGEMFGGNAGNVGESETVDGDYFADMSERDLIEHVGKVPKKFKEIVENNIFQWNFSSDGYVLAFTDKVDGDIVVYDKSCKIVDTIDFENGNTGVFGSYQIYRLSDGNYIKLSSYSSYYLSHGSYAGGETSGRIENKAFVEIITSAGKTVFKTEFDVRNDLEYYYELDDGYIVAGWEQKWSDTVNQSYYIYKLDKSGNIVQQRSLDDVYDIEYTDGELIVYTRQRQWAETVYVDAYRRHYLNDDLSTRATDDGVSPDANKSKRIEDYIPDFDAGNVTSVIYYDDFVLIISERNTKWFEYTPMIYSSMPSYTETVYTAYTYDAEMIWRSAVDSTDYEELAAIKKEYDEEQARIKK